MKLCLKGGKNTRVPVIPTSPVFMEGLQIVGIIKMADQKKILANTNVVGIIKMAIPKNCNFM